MRVHAQKADPVPVRPGVAHGLIEHGLRVVHRRHVVAALRQPDGEKARSRTDVEDLHIPALRQVLLDHSHPVGLVLVRHLVLHDLGIALGAAGPVLFDLVEQRVHAITSRLGS